MTIPGVGDPMASTASETLAAMEPGTRSVADLPVEDDLDVPLTLLRGHAERPVGAVVAGVHGDEVEGMAALGDVVRSLDPTALAGSLIVVHAANPAGMRAGTRLHPPDDGDLNRAFSATAATATERLAAVLSRRLLKGLDALLTLHSWSRTGEAVSYTEYPMGSSAVEVASRALARALGTEYMEAYDWPPGMLPAEGVRRGVPSVEIEVGGLGRDTPEGRATVTRAVTGFLAHTGIERRAAGCGGEPVEVRRTTLTAPASGLVRHLVELGARVQAGRPCAEIRSVRGEVQGTLTPSRNGVIGIRFRFGWVERGTPVAAVFHPG
jgi:predicted deacylase